MLALETKTTKQLLYICLKNLEKTMFQKLKKGIMTIYHQTENNKEMKNYLKMEILDLESIITETKYTTGAQEKT